MTSGFGTGMAVEWRRAMRGLVRAPGFAAGVVLVLGIAIAGTVTVATAAYELFLEPLPFVQPERLVDITARSRKMGFEGFSVPMLGDMREQPMLLEVAAHEGTSPVASPSGDVWQRARVTHNLVDVLGVQPIAGRAFLPADGEPGAAPVALISESAWRNRLGGAASAIGSELILGDERVRVVGVVPADFAVPSPATEVWQPLAYSPEQFGADNIGSFTGGHMIGRLEPGATAAGLGHALRARYATDARARLRRIHELMGIEVVARDLRAAWTEEQRQPLAIIGLASALVLAAALFNVAGLWMSRLLGRAQEQAVEAALGAGRWRRLSRTLIEFTLLGGAGAALALALTPLMLQGLKRLGTLNLDQPLRIDVGPVILPIALAILLMSALPVMLAALWQQRSQRTVDLKSGGRGQAGSGARARRTLIVAQVALAMSLLCAMGLLLKSWHGLLSEDLGFEPRSLLLARIYGTRSTDPGPQQSDPRVAAALEGLRAIPGVQSVAHTNVAPFSRSESVSRIPVPGQPDRETSVRARVVGETFFRTTGIPIARGRSFDPDDAGSRAVVVDEYFASLFFPGQDVVGQSIQLPIGDEQLGTSVIVGVAGNAKYRAPDEEPDQGTVYQFAPEPMAYATAIVSASVPPQSLFEEVEEALDRTVGAERVGEIVTMQSLVRDTVRDREPQLILLALFGGETLVLAAIGLFSLLAYSVRARTAEFGVRQAVGAGAGDIRRLVLADAARLLVPGLVVGAAGAWAAGHVVANRLYEVSPADPLTWLTVGLLLALVVFGAGLWPAERAARVQPTEALRYE